MESWASASKVYLKGVFEKWDAFDRFRVSPLRFEHIREVVVYRVEDFGVDDNRSIQREFGAASAGDKATCCDGIPAPETTTMGYSACESLLIRSDHTGEPRMAAGPQAFVFRNVHHHF